MEVATGLGRDWGHEHGHGEVEAADEGVVEGRGAGKDIVVDVVGEEDAVGLDWGVVSQAFGAEGMHGWPPHSDNAPGEAIDEEDSDDA